jgi:hypothetical protein
VADHLDGEEDLPAEGATIDTAAEDGTHE